ncbi:MAG: DUF3043 domain-containing protein [Micrococcales bacterium]|nr:DUF3043 domain-containing protein [Micrococcales bacterium]
MFGRGKQTAAEAEPVASEIGKGRSTPSRREREAANRRPLVPTDRRQASRENRSKSAAARERARIGMMNGEEKYLPVRDRGAQKRFARDYMDARYSFGEFVLPLAVLVVISSALPPEIGQLLIFGVWAYFALSIIDFVIVGHRITRRLDARFGDKTERIRFYVAMRGIYPRFMRAPKPQVKRRQFPTL